MTERIAPGKTVFWRGKTGEVVAFIPKGETIRSAVRDKMRGLAYLAMVRQLARRCTEEISQRDRYLIKVGDQHYCPPAGVVKVGAAAEAAAAAADEA